MRIVVGVVTLLSAYFHDPRRARTQQKKQRSARQRRHKLALANRGHPWSSRGSRGKAMNWLLSAGEIFAGVALFAGTAVVVALLRPPAGQLQERLIVRFPGAWIVVGLLLTLSFATSVALLAVGTGILR
jgi:hypothetical protein